MTSQNPVEEVQIGSSEQECEVGWAKGAEKLFVAGSESIEVFQNSNGHLVKAPSVSIANAQGLSVDAHGRRIATVESGSITKVWDVADPNNPKELAKVSWHSRPLFTDQPDWLLTKTEQETHIWSLAGLPALESEGSVVGTPHRWDAPWLFTWEQHYGEHMCQKVMKTGGSLHLWNRQKLPARRPTATREVHHDELLCSASSAKRKLFAMGGQRDLVQIVSLDKFSDKPVGSWTAHDGRGNGVFSLAFNAEGTLLATGNFDGSVEVWSIDDLSAPKRVHRLEWHSVTVTNVIFLANDSYLLSLSYDNQLALWRVA